jgi:hypothetical protein
MGPVMRQGGELGPRSFRVAAYSAFLAEENFVAETELLVLVLAVYSGRGIAATSLSICGLASSPRSRAAACIALMVCFTFSITVG